MVVKWIVEHRESEIGDVINRGVFKTKKQALIEFEKLKKKVLRWTNVNCSKNGFGIFELRRRDTRNFSKNKIVKKCDWTYRPFSVIEV